MGGDSWEVVSAVGCLGNVADVIIVLINGGLDLDYLADYPVIALFATVNFPGNIFVVILVFLIIVVATSGVKVLEVIVAGYFLEFGISQSFDLTSKEIIPLFLLVVQVISRCPDELFMDLRVHSKAQCGRAQHTDGQGFEHVKIRIKII